MPSIPLRLILPLFFHTAITTAIYLLTPLGPLESTAISALLCTPALACIYTKDQTLRPLTPSPSIHLLPIPAFGASLCILLNTIITALNLPQNSPAYQEAAKAIYSPPFTIQLLSTALIIPIAEELIFRGMIFAPIRDKLPFLPSACISALIFALYHGNLPQGVYGFFIGIAAAWLYELYKSLSAPMLLHISANLLSLCITQTPFFPKLFTAPTQLTLAATAIIFAALSIICGIWIYQKNTLKEDIL
ncbi:MAG: CPBP family intramembrane metalloprotease, partial [Lacrimispora sp.]|uniref:CPBP family intramembrane glutamic endopeptidase n=1 Tax=Lacrimispora sp. TaxID=2719234 RepID=UPI0039E3B72E